MDFDARCEGPGPGLAVAPDAQIANLHTLDGPRLVMNERGPRKAGIDLDAERLGLARQPAADLAQRAHKHAMIMDHRGHHEAGQRQRPLFAEKQEFVFGDGGIER